MVATAVATGRRESVGTDARRYRRAPCRGAPRRPSGVCEVVDDRREVLSVGDQSHHVEVVGAFEVEPTTREAGHPLEPQAREVAELTDVVGNRCRACVRSIAAPPRPHRRTARPRSNRLPDGSSACARSGQLRPAAADQLASRLIAERPPPELVHLRPRQPRWWSGFEADGHQLAHPASRLLLLIAADQISASTHWCCRTHRSGPADRCTRASTPARRSSSCSDSPRQLAGTINSCQRARDHGPPRLSRFRDARCADASICSV